MICLTTKLNFLVLYLQTDFDTDELNTDDVEEETVEFLVKVETTEV